MTTGQNCDAGGEPNLDDLVAIVAYCTAKHADYSACGWDEIEPLLEQGWPAVRGERNTRWEAVRELARLCWLQSSDGDPESPDIE
jgi:hypothetical protein